MKTLEGQKLTFEALSDPTRLRMVRILRISNVGLCQCELVDILETSPSNVSRHAKILFHAGLTIQKKDGKWLYYNLTDRAPDILMAITKGKDPVFESDQKRLQKRLNLRSNGKCLVGLRG